MSSLRCTDRSPGILPSDLSRRSSAFPPKTRLRVQGQPHRLKRPAKTLDRFVATGDDFFERLAEARLASLSEIGGVCAQCRHRRSS
jgi:hypothetical protein